MLKLSAIFFIRDLYWKICLVSRDLRTNKICRKEKNREGKAIVES